MSEKETSSSSSESESEVEPAFTIDACPSTSESHNTSERNKGLKTSSSSSESESEDEPTFAIDTCSSTSTASHNMSKRNKGLSKPNIEIPGISKRNITLSSSLQPGIDLSDTYINIFPEKGPKDVRNKLNQLSMMTTTNDELLKNSIVCKPGFEKQYSVPPYIESLKKIKKERLKERDKTKGQNWYHLPATELTEERKNDLKLLQMRNSLDPKHFYKRSTEKTLPKYFRIGTVVEPPIDFYHARIPKKQRKQTLVDELLADAKLRQYSKRKYAEFIKSQPKKIYHSHKRKKSKKIKE